jgi:hypothetical protein
MTDATSLNDRWRTHQFVHGYRDGHRMLAGSTTLDPDVARRIDRLSDASGQQPSGDNDGYLTGYPLPGRGFALARTWYDDDAPRPNAVWTHTLVLPPSVLAAHSLYPLIDSFSRPSADRLDQYMEPLDLAHIALSMAWQAPVAPLELLKDLLSKLYGLDESPVAAECVGVATRNDIALAVWSQQWPRLRRTFAFCSGALEPRTIAKGSPFALLLGPPGAHLMRWSLSLQGRVDDDVAQALALDLYEPGHLRELLWTVGADTGRRRFAGALASVLMGALEHPPDVDRSLGSIASLAPGPKVMRRIKRELLRSPHPLLSAANPLDVVDLLTTQAGDAVLADDASVDYWTRRSWDLAPAAVLDRVGRLSGRPPVELDASSGEQSTLLRETDLKSDGLVAEAPVTARLALDASLSRAIAANAQPRDLAVLAQRNPRVAIEAVRGGASKDARWWREWADLSDELFKEVVTAARIDPERAAGALIGSEWGAVRWREHRELRTDKAMIAVLGEVGDVQQIPQSWMWALSEDGDQIARLVVAGMPLPQLSGAADLSPVVPRLSRLPWKAWRGFALDQTRWSARPVRTALVFVVASQSSISEADPIMGFAYERLYDSLATNRADDAWSVVAATYKVDSGDWDRCAQLARIAYAQARKRDARGADLVSSLRGSAAREALIDVARQDLATSKKRKGRRPWNLLIDVLRDL